MPPQTLTLTKAEANVLLKAVSRTSIKDGNSGGMQVHVSEVCLCCAGEYRDVPMAGYGKTRSVIAHQSGCLTVKLHNFVHGSRQQKFLERHNASPTKRV